MFDLKKFLDVDKLKSILGKKSDASSETGERTENIQVEEDKIDAEISAIENEEKGGSSEPVPFFKDKKKVIRVVIILAVGYLILDQFVLTTNEPDPFANIPTPVKKNKKNRNKTATATEALTATGTGDAAIPTPIASTAPAQATLAPEATPNSGISEVPIAPTPLPEATVVAEPSPTPEVVSTPAVVATAEATPDMSTPEVVPGMGETSHQTPKKDDFGSKLTEMLSPEATVTPKKMEVKEYVSPPEFDTLGRGLVYNCKGRHWACVDKDSFLRCRQNETWQRSVGKLPECSARNVYSSIDDCKIVQTHNINTAVSTEFCK